MKILFTFSLSLIAVVTAPSQAFLDPTRVAVLALADNDRNRQFADNLRSELRRRGYVSPTAENARRDYTVLSIVASLDSQCSGLMGTVIIAGNKRSGAPVIAGAADNLDRLAREMIDHLDREFFAKRRAQKD